MTKKRRAKCAVLECTAPTKKNNKLCYRHRSQSVFATTADGTMGISLLYGERANEDEHGIIVLLDWVLATEPGGAKGFAKRLRKQGFTNVRLLQTDAEIQAARVPKPGMIFRAWPGSSLTPIGGENR